VRHRPISQGEAFVEETPLRLLMVHDLYVALALMSGQEPVSFQARHGYSKPGRADLSVAQVEWPGGVVGSLTASFLTPAGMPADGFDRLEVFGEGWAARMNLNPRPLEVWSERAEWPLQLDILADPAAPSGWLAEELRHFCRVVRGVEPVRMGARYEDGLRVQRWLEQLEHSASKRETNHA
jgi:predicted dehydrogenase